MGYIRYNINIITPGHPAKKTASICSLFLYRRSDVFLSGISSNIAHIRNVKDSVLDLTVVRNIFLWVFPMIGVKIFLFFRHTVSVRHVDHVVLALFRRSVEDAVGIIRDLAVAYFKTCIGIGGFLRLIALVKTSPKGKRRVRARISARMCLCGRCDSCLLQVDVPARLRRGAVV